MAAQFSSKSNLQVAHILFVDVVGFSKLSANKQGALVAQLNEIVRETESYRGAKARDALMSLPAGDGVGLIFFDSP